MNRQADQTIRPMQLVAFSWLVVTLGVLVIGFREAIFLVPTDAAQGDVGRIFYYHVPIAMLSLAFPFLNFAASLAFLYWRHRDPLKALSADAMALASAEVTIVYLSIVLSTGMLWGKAAWGIWWTWDARLTSLLLLWLLYVSYLIVRRFSSTGQSQTIAAILSVFAAVDSPIVYMSIRWWRTQHPAPVFGGGPGSGLDKSMMPAFVWNIAAWAMWGIFITGYRYALERRRQIAEQDAALSAIEASLELTQ
ncbi:cytochrome c biogenesis protein CcsA [Granulicella arctica]|uniref:Heme exporter protein C n=1 Tax=Granulicella arctica TaxID=940613 RepID=A0A7Y9TMG1_9BACT|nr:cytochrome c biogenesis protein CcsA [Granulicella arctica]NYF81102.1 heme exporter protein C [Granulicella arctica]